MFVMPSKRWYASHTLFQKFGTICFYVSSVVILHCVVDGEGRWGWMGGQWVGGGDASGKCACGVDAHEADPGQPGEP